MERSEVLNQRKQARLEKSQRDADLLSAHRRIADMLRGDDRDSVIDRALEQIDKWESGSLCNPRYISEWRKILSLDTADMCASIVHDDANGVGVALRQNSPFGFLLKDL